MALASPATAACNARLSFGVRFPRRFFGVFARGVSIVFSGFFSFGVSASPVCDISSQVLLLFNFLLFLPSLSCCSLSSFSVPDSSFDSSFLIFSSSLSKSLSLPPPLVFCFFFPALLFPAGLPLFLGVFGASFGGGPVAGTNDFEASRKVFWASSESPKQIGGLFLDAFGRAGVWRLNSSSLNFGFWDFLTHEGGD